MVLPVTLCTAAAAALLTMWMMVRCGKLRMEKKIMHGDGGDAAMGQRMRAQLNFVESAPFILLLIAGIEIAGRGGTWLAIVAAAYMIARVLHMLGMDSTKANPMRAIGTITTMLSLVGLSVVAVLIALGAI